MPAQDFLERAQALADDGQQEIAELEARRAKIDEDIRKIRAFVRAVRPPVPKPPKATPKPRSVSPERALTVAEAILAMPELDRDFVARDVRALPSIESLPEGGVYAALDTLRTVGFLRMTGKRKNGRGRSVDHYRVMDREVLSTLREAANG